jgi:hypothetical protein
MGTCITPVPEEFDVTRTLVVHRPTGAMWTTTADSKFPDWFDPGDLGLALPTGATYRADEVIEMGQRLLAERIPQANTKLTPN